MNFEDWARNKGYCVSDLKSGQYRDPITHKLKESRDSKGVLWKSMSVAPKDRMINILGTIDTSVKECSAIECSWDNTFQCFATAQGWVVVGVAWSEIE